MLIAIAVAVVEFMPMGGYVPAIQKLASDHIQEPVTIGSVNVSVVSGLKIHLENVKIGTTQDVSLNNVTLEPELGSIFGERKVIRAIRVDGGSVAGEVLGRLPQWFAASVADQRVQVGRIELRAIKPDMRQFELPAMNVELDLNADQSIRSAGLATSDGKFSAQLTPENGVVQVAITAANWTPPLGAPLEIVDLTASGSASAGALRLDQWEARLYDGAAKGSALVSWADGWGAQGQFEFARVEVSRLLGVFTRTARTSGIAEGQGTLTLRGASPNGLFESPRADIEFTVRRGNLDGVDLVRALQVGREGTQGGSTKFEELSGSLTLAGNRYQYRNVRLSAGILTANGSFDIAPNQEVSGRVNVELRSQAQQLRNSLNITGSLQGISLRP